MSTERKLVQAVVVGIKAIGFTLKEQGLTSSPNLTPEKEIEMVLKPSDFENEEDFYTVANLVTNAIRAKATTLIEEGRADELNPSKK